MIQLLRHRRPAQTFGPLHAFGPIDRPVLHVDSIEVAEGRAPVILLSGTDAPLWIGAPIPHEPGDLFGEVDAHREAVAVARQRLAVTLARALEG